MDESFRRSKLEDRVESSWVELAPIRYSDICLVRVPVDSSEFILGVEYSGAKAARLPEIRNKTLYSGGRLTDRCCNELFPTQRKKAHRRMFIFNYDFDLLDRTVPDNCWLMHKAKEITDGAESVEEKVERIFNYVRDEINYTYAPKCEIERFRKFLESRGCDKIKDPDEIECIVREYFPYLKQRLLQNVRLRIRDANGCRKSFEKDLAIVESGFDGFMDKCLEEYDVKSHMERLKGFLSGVFASMFMDFYAGKWHIFRYYLQNPSLFLDPIFIFNNGGVCVQKDIVFRGLCNQVGISTANVSGWTTLNNKWESHAWSAVQIKGKWEMVDVTNNYLALPEREYFVDVRIKLNKSQELEHVYYTPVKNH